MSHNEKLKERRINKLGDKQFEEMSGTTRNLFKKWGHKREEILNWQKTKTFRRIKQARREAAQEKKLRVVINVWQGGKLTTY